MLFPGRRYVALYGHPATTTSDRLVSSPWMRPPASAGPRYPYDGISPEFVVPTFEIITTVAAVGRRHDGNYSLESSLDHIRPWVDAAGAAGFYVVLDLQPGYADFLTQAQRYEELLAQPHVGLALDPEWRLAPGSSTPRHRTGSAEEVNRVASWLAELTRRHNLPQKMLVLHQFRLDMLPDREHIVVPPELAWSCRWTGSGPGR